jgi:hypothetical protein
MLNSVKINQQALNAAARMTNSAAQSNTMNDFMVVHALMLVIVRVFMV